MRMHAWSALFVRVVDESEKAFCANGIFLRYLHVVYGN